MLILGFLMLMAMWWYELCIKLKQMPLITSLSLGAEKGVEMTGCPPPSSRLHIIPGPEPRGRDLT